MEAAISQNYKAFFRYQRMVRVHKDKNSHSNKSEKKNALRTGMLKIDRALSRTMRISKRYRDNNQTLEYLYNEKLL